MGDTTQKNSLYMQATQWLTKTISEAKWTKIAKVYLVIFLFIATGIGCFFAYKTVSNEAVIKATAEKLHNSIREDHVREEVVTPKIQKSLEILTYMLNADRAFVFELHNGKKNTCDLPFHFADMSYEETNENRHIDKIAMQYQNVPLTLYRFPHHIRHTKKFVGSVEEIAKIDRGFADEIRKSGGCYLGFMYISSRGIPIGFIGVSYHDINDVPNADLLELKLSEYSRSLSNLLDLQHQSVKG